MRVYSLEQFEEERISITISNYNYDYQINWAFSVRMPID